MDIKPNINNHSKQCQRQPNKNLKKNEKLNDETHRTYTRNPNKHTGNNINRTHYTTFKLNPKTWELKKTEQKPTKQWNIKHHLRKKPKKRVKSREIKHTMVRKLIHLMIKMLVPIPILPLFP